MSLQDKRLYVCILLVVSGYVPFAFGGWYHPAEINVAAYGTWLILSITFGYSMWDQGQPSWKLLFGFFTGNLFMCLFALYVGGYTFNLGLEESVVMFGLIGSFCLMVVWATIRKWESRILLYGSMLSDLASIYPLFKQYYLDAHEPMTPFGLVGWVMWFAAVCVTLLWAEQMPQKMWMPAGQYLLVYGHEKSRFKIFEESLFTLSQVTYIPIAIVLMAR